MNEVKYVNMTLHPVMLHVEHGFGQVEVITFPPSGEVARTSERRVDMGGLGYARVERVEYSAVEGLPPVEPGVYLIVSGFILAAAPDRPDLLAPARPVRDAEGRMLGYRGWTCTPAWKPPQVVIDYSHATPQAAREAWLASQNEAREEQDRQAAAKALREARQMRDD